MKIDLNTVPAIAAALTSGEVQEVAIGLVQSLRFPSSRPNNAIRRKLLTRLSTVMDGRFHDAEFIVRKAFYAHPMGSREQLFAWDAYMALLPTAVHHRYWTAAEEICNRAYIRSPPKSPRERNARRTYWGLLGPVRADGKLALARRIVDQAYLMTIGLPMNAQVRRVRLALLGIAPADDDDRPVASRLVTT